MMAASEEYNEVVYTPYDWQEGIGNRAQYIEGRLRRGAPVLAVSLDEGILMLSFRRQARKVYEVYDRLAYAGIGQQSDVESIRLAAVEFAHQEGYNRSEQDVTIQRVVTALSGPIKKAFGDFGAAPLVARSLFAEVHATPDEDLYYTLEFDGDYGAARRFAVVEGSGDASKLTEQLALITPDTGVEAAVERLTEIWNLAQAEEEAPVPEGLRREVVLISRRDDRENRFTWREGEHLN